MATKSYKLRLDLRTWEGKAVDAERFAGRQEEVTFLKAALDDTRVAFNEGVDYLALWLLRLHRGVGVFRERTDGIWGEWQTITSHSELCNAREKLACNREEFALLENRDLIKIFIDQGKSEQEAAELANCCRRVAEHLCPEGDPEDRAQMPRDDLDLLTLSTSTAKGLRERGISKSGQPKKQGGRKPRWALKRAAWQVAEANSTMSWNDFEEELKKREEFRSAVKDGQTFLGRLKNKHGKTDWGAARPQLLADLTSWQSDKAKAEAKLKEDSETGGIAAYRQLREAGCLPLRGLERPAARLRTTGALAEWNYAMWNMAGQRVRSHLGWVRRRADERLLWERKKLLFERGGWIRIKRGGKDIKTEGVTRADIRFTAPDSHDAADFKERPGYGKSTWFTELRRYETEEMPEHLRGVQFGAAGQQNISGRTAKGWSSVRSKWRDLLQKGKTGQADLVDALNDLRAREPRGYGDQRLFEWLADPCRHWLWSGLANTENGCGRDDGDCLTALVHYNEQFAEKPTAITFTRPDPRSHPVWPFYGENSAVKYLLRRETRSDGKLQFVLVLGQLLKKQQDGAYTAVDDVKIPLRGYFDFERSFKFPDGKDEVTAKEELSFRDDLLAGNSRKGCLGGLKLVWERPPSSRSRIFASFSCTIVEIPSPGWQRDVTVKGNESRDGLKQPVFLRATIRGVSKTTSASTPFAPGTRKWPLEAVANGFAIRGTDLGFRCSSAGAIWRLTFDKPADQAMVVWDVGESDGKRVFAVLERSSRVSLPGDGEEIPRYEQELRDRLYRLRARLNLNNTLLRTVRLLILAERTRRVPCGMKMRRRDGKNMPAGIQWKTYSVRLTEAEVRENCRKVAERLLRWAATDAMTESFAALGHSGTFWDWLRDQNADLGALAERVPLTAVPTEAETKEKGLDRSALLEKRKAEDTAFADVIFSNRLALARALCHGHDPQKGKRATQGVWAEFDRALKREISYGGTAEGLLPLLRKPPVTKHRDRKDVNGLPLGQTHRGGLSMARLNFLDDVKNFVRRWSCRPRWPGDVRRVPENASFDRPDTEHLDHIREHRAKLIAHADVAQTLGFEQDLRRGLWLYRDSKERNIWQLPERGHFYQLMNGSLKQCEALAGLNEQERHHPHRAYPGADLLVYEDLSRYKYRADRPRNENAGLARWSHRRILHFAEHIGSLFGVPIAVVPAAYSSRFCSRCGAPGCRTSRFDLAWLQQRWMQRVLNSADIRDAALKSTARIVQERISCDPNAYQLNKERPWVLRDGGTHFVCSNRACLHHSRPIDADENAAANIGLRFLRGTDDFKVWITGDGRPRRQLTYQRVIQFVERTASDASKERFWTAQSDADSDGIPRRYSGRRRKALIADGGRSFEADDGEDETESGLCQLFRDPSGHFRPADCWFDRKVFWGLVAAAASSGIAAANARGAIAG